MQAENYSFIFIFILRKTTRYSIIWEEVAEMYLYKEVYTTHDNYKQADS